MNVLGLFCFQGKIYSILKSSQAGMIKQFDDYDDDYYGDDDDLR